MNTRLLKWTKREAHWRASLSIKSCRHVFPVKRDLIPIQKPSNLHLYSKCGQLFVIIGEMAGLLFDRSDRVLCEDVIPPQHSINLYHKCCWNEISSNFTLRALDFEKSILVTQSYRIWSIVTSAQVVDTNRARYVPSRMSPFRQHATMSGAIYVFSDGIKQ